MIKLDDKIHVTLCAKIVSQHRTEDLQSPYTKALAYALDAVLVLINKCHHRLKAVETLPEVNPASG